MTEAYLSNVEDVLINLLPESGVVSKIVDDMRDYFVLDYLEQIRNETDYDQVFELIQNDPWTNERVAVAALQRIPQIERERLNLLRIERKRAATAAGFQPSPNIVHFRRNVETVVLPRMAAHGDSARVQLEGSRVISRAFTFPPYSVFATMLRAMVLHENDAAIHAQAVRIFRYGPHHRLHHDHDAPRFLKYLQASEGNGQLIAVLFRALETFPNNRDVIGGTLYLLLKLSHHSLGLEALVEYTQTHPDWRKLIGNTDPAHRPRGAFLGERFENFGPPAL